MSTVNKVAGTALAGIADALSHAVSILLPQRLYQGIAQGRKRVSEGDLSVAFKVHKALGANTTGLSISVKPIIRFDEATSTVCNLANATGYALIVSAFDFDADTWYTVPILEPLGPCDGLEVTFTYANGAIGEVADIASYLVASDTEGVV